MLLLLSASKGHFWGCLLISMAHSAGPAFLSLQVPFYHLPFTITITLTFDFLLLYFLLFFL
jgi:hypothetical protein